MVGTAFHWATRVLLVAVLAVTASLEPAAAPSENKHGVAVIIGNRAYAGRVPTVDYAHNDAEAIKRYVIDVLRFRPGNVIDLRDAAQAQMLSVFGNRETHKGRLFQIVRPGKSDVVVYFSGHGVPGPTDKRGYLLPVDADPSTPEINGYPVDLLYDNLAKIEARSVTVMLDACFSGDSARGMLIEDASPVFIKSKLPGAVEGLTVLTAAQGDQLASWDDDARHGLFTEHVLRALYGAADTDEYGNGDGRVTAAEIKAYLDEEMTYAARHRYNRRQEATILGDGARVLAAFAPGQHPERPSVAAPAASAFSRPSTLDAASESTAQAVAPRPPEVATKPLSFQVNYVHRAGATGPFKPFGDGATLHSGDQYKILFTPSEDAWVYIFQVDSAGQVFRLFPMRAFGGVRLDNVNPATGGKTHVLPARDKAFQLDDQTGTERIYFVASRRPDRELEGLNDKLENARATRNLAGTRSTEARLRQVFTNRGVAGIVSLQSDTVTWEDSGGTVFSVVESRLEGLCDTCVNVIEFSHR